jgi:hypothetical protein
VSVRADSLYGVLEFSFKYEAGKPWDVLCRVSAVEKNPLCVLGVSSENDVMDDQQWHRFLGDMGLLEDFKHEAMLRGIHFLTALRRPPAEA